VRALTEEQRARKNARRRQYYIENKEQVAESNRAYRSRNIERHREYSRAHYQANRDRMLEQRMARYRLLQYGLTPDDFAALLERQGGVCAICLKPESWRGPSGRRAVASLAVDHDHHTGRVRGLLCRRCNQAIGGFGDDPDALRRASRYLEGASCPA
jgi:hypothetical protein